VKDNQTFGHLLSLKLGKDYEVLNFGVAGFNAKRESELFLKKGIKYKPDWVIVQYFGNDAENFEIYLKIVQTLSEKHNLSERKAAELAYKKFLPAYNNWLYSKMPLKELFEERIFKYYHEIINSSKSNHFKILFIIFPDQPNKEEVLKEYFEENNQTAIFLKDIGYAYEKPWVLNDGHPSPYSHKKIAEILYNFISKSITNN
jgi:hypothetical protein